MSKHKAPQYPQLDPLFHYALSAVTNQQNSDFNILWEPNITSLQPMSIIALPLTSLIHPQILYERVNTQMVDRSSQSPEESPLSAIGAIQQTRKILDTTNKATKAVLSRVSDQKWWKKTLKAIQPHRSTSVIENVDSNNEKFEKQGCHPFYKSVLEDAFKNKVLSTSTNHLYLVAIFNT